MSLEILIIYWFWETLTLRALTARYRQVSENSDPEQKFLDCFNDFSVSTLKQAFPLSEITQPMSSISSSQTKRIYGWRRYIQRTGLKERLSRLGVESSLSCRTNCYQGRRMPVWHSKLQRCTSRHGDIKLEWCTCRWICRRSMGIIVH
jgi:hypothetical protein